MKEGKDVRQRALLAADGSRTSCVTMAMVEVQISMPGGAGGPSACSLERPQHTDIDR